MFIRTNKIEDEKVLERLQRHFPGIVPAEKYPDAMMTLLIDEVCDQVLGKNYKKERISRRNCEKIKKKILDRLRKKYGRWINLNNFKFKKPGQMAFSSNFSRVYRNGSGYLYNIPVGFFDEMFLSDHCMERFEERSYLPMYRPIYDIAERYGKGEPTTADILFQLLVNTNYEYARRDEFVYLNLRIGVIVLEDLGDLYIAKTFLFPGMLKMDVEWRQPLLNEDQYHNTLDYWDSIRDIFKLDYIKIKGPDFLIDSEILEGLKMLDELNFFQGDSKGLTGIQGPNL